MPSQTKETIFPTFNRFKEHLRTESSFHLEANDTATFCGVRFYSAVAEIILRHGYRTTKEDYGISQVQDGAFEVIKVCYELGADIFIDGLQEAAKLEGPAVIIANHMSSLETLIMPGLLAPYQPVTFVVKESLSTYPMISRFLKSINAVTVSRKNPKADLRTALEGAERAAAKGFGTVIFPQSTRSTTFDPGKFNTIGLRVAKSIGLPVLPICLRTDLWGTGTVIKDFGPIDLSKPLRVEFGTPFFPDKIKEDQTRIIDFISSRLEAWDVDKGTDVG